MKTAAIASHRLLQRWRLAALAVLVAAAAFHLRPAQSAQPASAQATPAAGCASLLDVTFPRLQDESPQRLCQYQGKVLLVVNTASYCGYTRQYESLEKLYAKYRERGLVVLAFPSNDFGQQEPGDAKQIADLCFNTYGVKFPIFSKTVVTGPQANPLFASLTKATGKAPAWNFHKYLVDRSGQPIASFPSNLDPMDPRVQREIERLLAKPAA